MPKGSLGFKLMDVIPDWQAKSATRWDRQSRRQLMTSLRYYAQFKSASGPLSIRIQELLEIPAEYSAFLKARGLSASACNNYPSLLRRLSRDLAVEGIFKADRQESAISPAWAAIIQRVKASGLFNHSQASNIKVFALYSSERHREPDDVQRTVPYKEMVEWLKGKRYATAMEAVGRIRCRLRAAAEHGLMPLHEIEAGNKFAYGLPLRKWPSPMRGEFSSWLDSQRAPWLMRFNGQDAQESKPRRAGTLTTTQDQLEGYVGFRVRILEEDLEGAGLSGVITSVPHILNYALFLSCEAHERRTFRMMPECEVSRLLSTTRIPGGFRFVLAALIRLGWDLRLDKSFIQTVALIRKRLLFKRPRSKSEKGVHLEDLEAMARALGARADRKEAQILDALHKRGLHKGDLRALTPELVRAGSEIPTIRKRLRRLALLRRDQLLIAQFTARPLRVMNHAMIQMGTHIREVNDGLGNDLRT